MVGLVVCVWLRLCVSCGWGCVLWLGLVCEVVVVGVCVCVCVCVWCVVVFIVKRGVGPSRLQKSYFYMVVFITPNSSAEKSYFYMVVFITEFV